jgi:hypothetical protein
MGAAAHTVARVGTVPADLSFERVRALGEGAAQ